MTQSKEYQESDAFKRKLLREIQAGRKLLKKGWGNTFPLPADVRTLESVKRWYDIFRQKGCD
jgi:hypothetical protein